MNGSDSHSGHSRARADVNVRYAVGGIVAALLAGLASAANAQSVTPEPTPTAQTNPSFQAGPLTIIPGGWVELMVIDRSRDEGADWASNFNTSIPYPNSHYYYMSEFRLTERQSRLQALILGPQELGFEPSAYVETDFGGAGSTANLNQSNSFSPRVRHFYAELKNDPGNWYLLFGQTWSLVTTYRSLLTPRDENIPITIDGQYVPGFDWLRVPQIRAVKMFGDTGAIGLSLENPQQQVSANTSSNAAPTPYVYNITGASSAYSGTVTTDFMPDVVLKGALDPGWGHYELFGVARGFQSRYTATGSEANEQTIATAFGWGYPSAASAQCA